MRTDQARGSDFNRSKSSAWPPSHISSLFGHFSRLRPNATRQLRLDRRYRRRRSRVEWSDVPQHDQPMRRRIHVRHLFESQTAQRAQRATALECAESQGESSRDGSANQLATPREFFASALYRLIPKTSRGHDEIRLLFRQAFALEPDAASHPR